MIDWCQETNIITSLMSKSWWLEQAHHYHLFLNTDWIRFQILNTSTRNISSGNTAGTSLHIYIECAEEMSIPCQEIYSEFRNKRWPYLYLSLRLISPKNASIDSLLSILVTIHFIHQRNINVGLSAPRFTTTIGNIFKGC